MNTETSKKIKNWNNCEFKIGAMTINDIPPSFHSEIAFAGRSNVGKSSLINSLTDRTKLSRTSKNPGCTRQLNFFLLDEKIMLVDMPGYGYAKRDKKTIAGWSETIQSYLIGRPQLRRIFLLIDSRHGLKPSDLEIMKLLDESAVSYQIIFTKIDKTPKNQFLKLQKKVEDSAINHPAQHPKIIGTSSAEKLGIDLLRNEISSLI